jgi:hypothetical protein
MRFILLAAPYAIATSPSSNIEMTTLDQIFVNLDPNESVLKPKRTGKCSESELAIWYKNLEFSAKMDTYARWNAGRGSIVAAKLMEDYPLSPSCASCHGDAVSCGTRKCWMNCILSSTSESCIECSRRECLAAYMECVGVSDEALMPPNPRAEESTTTSAPKRIRSTTTPIGTSTVTADVSERNLLQESSPDTVTPLPSVASTFSTYLPLDEEVWTSVDVEDIVDDPKQL